MGLGRGREKGGRVGEGKIERLWGWGGKDKRVGQGKTNTWWGWGGEDRYVVGLARGR